MKQEINENLPILTPERISELRDIRKNGINRLGKTSKKRFSGGFAELSQILYEESIKPGMLFDSQKGPMIKYGSISDAMGMERFYRGENQIYPGDANSTLGRVVKDLDDLTTYVYLLIERIQTKIFGDFLIDENIRNNWRHGNIFISVIAQHYGLETRFLDVTDDIDIALFFANTKVVDGKYVPILSNDCTEAERYAVMYCRSPKMFVEERIHEIGYQPFARCHKQRGYYIDTSKNGKINEYGLEKNDVFTKYKFLRDDNLTMEIFEQFNGGDDLLPSYEKNILINVIKEIKNIKCFTKNEITASLIIEDSAYSYEVVSGKIKSLGYSITNEVERSQIKLMLQIISFEEFIKREGIKIHSSKIKVKNID